MTEPALGPDTSSTPDEVMLGDVPPRYIAPWLLRLPIGASVRSLYEESVTNLNDELLSYFESTEHISSDDRESVRDRCVASIKLMNAYQAWNWVAGRFIDSGMGVTLLSTWPISTAVFATLIWTTTPRPVIIAFTILCSAFLVLQFRLYLRDANPRQRLPTYLRVGIVVILLSSFFLLLSGWSSQDPVKAGASILVALPVAGIVTIAGVAILDIPNVSVRAAIYLIGLALLALPAAGDWRSQLPSWLGLGLLTAARAALAVLILYGGFHLLANLAPLLLGRWKVRQHPVDELIQTLALLGVLLNESEESNDERSLPGQESAITTIRELFLEMEYLAGIIENALARNLSTLDRSGDAVITKRCHGMAAALRELKVHLALDGRMTAEDIANMLIPAIVPMALGNWSQIKCLDQQEHQEVKRSGWRRALRIFGGIVAAIAPLAALLILRSTTTLVSEKVYDQTLPIVITWLLVSMHHLD